jgi:outer membrane protein
MRKISIRNIAAVIAVSSLVALSPHGLYAKPHQEPGSGQEGSGKPLELVECYNLALKQSESIAISAELIKQAEAHFLQAFGTLLPQVSFSRSQFRENSDIFPQYNKGFDQKFVFKQALFSGFKEFAGISGSDFEKKQRKNELLRAKQLLFVDVSDAFYLLMEERQDLRTLEIVKDAFTERLEELKKREKLGKSRSSEVVSTEVQLYTILDQIQSVKNQELLARELLAFLIGRPVFEIKETELNFSLKPEAEYLAKAFSRQDVLAADFAWKVSKKSVAVAKSGFLPQLNLEADYYGHRSSSPSDSKWSGQLSLDVPIFEGTTTYGQVKEAVSQARQAELAFERSKRAASQDIHDSFVNTWADFSRRVVLKKALRAAELNYQLQLQDYKLNVVNNLEVLTAIQSLEDIRRSYNHVLYESKRFYWQLLAAAGEIDLDKIGR